MRPLCATFFAALVACSPVPDLSGRESAGVRDAPYPALLPLDTLLSGPEVRATPEAAKILEGRVARLRARADRLRGAVVDPATRRRMQRGVKAAF